MRIFNAPDEAAGEGYSQTFNLRYGVSNEKAIALSEHAKENGLNVTGIVFHPGSGSEDPAKWDYGIQKAAELTKSLKDEGITIDTLNLSGGFDPSVSVEKYTNHIMPKIQQAYNKEGLETPANIDTEPGRWIVANSEVLIGKVSNVKMSEDEPPRKIVTLTTGVSENGTLPGLGLGFDFYQVDREKGTVTKLDNNGTHMGALHGRACADFDRMTAHNPKMPNNGDIPIPNEINPVNPNVDDIIMVASGAGAYSKFMERNHWCGIWPPVQADVGQFKQITDPEVYKEVVTENFGAKALLFVKSFVGLVPEGLNIKGVGNITSSMLAKISKLPEKVKELGQAAMQAVGSFVADALKR